MNFSAENTALWNFVVQFGIISIAIFLSNLAINRFKALRNLLIPPSVLAGIILLALRTFGVLNLDMAFAEMIVYHGIALGFIALSLKINAGNPDAGKGNGLISGMIIVASYLIQAVLGLGITVSLALTIMPGFFPAAGILLPMAFGQGTGQANNVGASYEALGFTGGRSFGLTLAAVGFLVACVVGVIIINYLVRTGAVKRPSAKSEGTKSEKSESYQSEGSDSITQSIDQASIQISLVFGIYLISYLMLVGITNFLTAYLPGLAKLLNPLLWGFNFMAGAVIAIIVKALLNTGKQSGFFAHQVQHNYILSRISGFFFDIMICAGIYSIELSDMKGYWLPFILLAVLGTIVTWYYLIIVCRKAYPGYEYEGILSMFGMLTGTISSGMLLLREIDPEFETPAANNLLYGSTTAILFGAPILVLIGIAPQSIAACLLTIAIAAVYFIALTFFIFRLSGKE